MIVIVLNRVESSLTAAAARGTEHSQPNENWIKHWIRHESWSERFGIFSSTDAKNNNNNQKPK